MTETRRFLLNQQEEKESASVRPSQPHFHKVKRHTCLQYQLPVMINHFCSDLWSLLLWEWAHFLLKVCEVCSLTQNWQHTATVPELLHLSSIFHSLETSAFQGQGYNRTDPWPRCYLKVQALHKPQHYTKDFSPAEPTEKNTIFKTDVPNPIIL